MLNSNAKFPIAVSPDAGAGSSARKRIRILLISIALICLWLTVRFPYEAESGLEHLLNGPNQINPQTLHLRGEFAALCFFLREAEYPIGQGT